MNKKIMLTLILLFSLISGFFLLYHDVGEDDDSLSNPEPIHYIKTLTDTELFDANHNAIGLIGENQTFAVKSINEGLLKLADLPFYVNDEQVEPVTALNVTETVDLDFSRYLAFEQMIAKGSTVSFYHLDHTFAFSLNHIPTDLVIYMQEDNRFYVHYLDAYFFVYQEEVTLIDHPHPLPETTEIPVLMYHFFCNSAEDIICKDNNWIEKDHFRDHMQYLSENHFISLKMIDIERFLNHQVRLPEQSVAITIDDGHQTVFDYAYPILAEFNQMATVFVITHKDLDIEALHTLNSHVELHSHTHDMYRGSCETGQGGLMLCIDFNQGVADLKQSRALLNDSSVFAYPFGDYNEHTLAMLQVANFSMAFTIEPGLVTKDSPPLLLPRVRVLTSTYLEPFKYLVNQS